MYSGIHNFSEIGKLNKVLLHRPGEELESLTPAIIFVTICLGGMSRSKLVMLARSPLAWILLMFKKSLTSWIWRAGSAMALATSST